MPNTITRSMHDLGLAAWFGGTLANAVALNAAAGAAKDATAAGAVTNTGWDRWTPVNAAAIGMHLTGSIGQLVGNKGRIFGQSGVGTMSIVKTAVTAAALGATAWSRILGHRVSQHHSVPVKDATTPTAATPPDIAAAQRQLTALQWAVPALTGALVLVSSFAGEQQRPTKVISGALHRIIG
jgi:hypothetical protein